MEPEISYSATSKQTKFLTPILVLVTLLSLGLSAFLYYQLKDAPLKNSDQTTVDTPPPQEVQFLQTTPPENLAPLSTDNPGFRVAQHGLFSYEYPEDWHVAEIWPVNSEGDIVIAMDPNPITTAPRDGPLGTFSFNLINGVPNADEIMQQRMNEFNEENYKEISQETLTSDIGEIFYYRGISKGPMYEDGVIEQYFFTFNKNSADPLNQQLIIASLIFNDDPKLSEMLRNIVLSFKQIN